MKQNYQPGDHLVVSKGLYTHHGIYVGSNQVIHYAGLSKDRTAKGSGVQITHLNTFTGGSRIRIKLHDRAPYQGEAVVNRALSRLGENQYNLLLNNCEHFVNWCIEGIESSEQVQTATTGTAIAIASGQLARSQLTRSASQIAISSGIGAGLAGKTAAVGTSTLVGSISTGAGAGSVAGPVGLAVGAACGLLGWGIYKLFE